MVIDIFVWAPPIPRDMFDDKEWLYPAITEEWHYRLIQSKGKRLPGPVQIKTMHFGYIDDNTMEEVMVLELSPLWTYAVVRVTGLAMHP